VAKSQSRRREENLLFLLLLLLLLLQQLWSDAKVEQKAVLMFYIGISSAHVLMLQQNQ